MVGRWKVDAFRTKHEVTGAWDGVFLHHLTPSSKTLDVTKKSPGRARLRLHQREAWCKRNHPAEPLVSMLPVLWGFIPTGFSCATVSMGSCSQSDAPLDYVLPFPLPRKELSLHFWAPPQTNPSAAKWGLPAAWPVRSSLVLKGEDGLVHLVKTYFAGSPVHGILHYKLKRRENSGCHYVKQKYLQ